ncbi:hypothetical protein [Micromonospora sp. WMMC273]|uniref:hypothetical protein n=1 Tax=Micromonospora sp. WMMC273 TaxID=3015157 RepID=UPI0022B62808|nr:hypothetical protein [Micromonospora sp. WMMC273]MCZ7478837.1 hypothetical protein [Micromonospora sp. WMMC273]MCZ7478965.1 hypothetical protein [Micromonospora sp. WMMC273]
MSGDVITVEELATVEHRLRTAMGRAFRAETASRERDPHHLGLSSVGTCTRRAAYALAKTPVSDRPPVREARQANLGTWEHAGLLPRLSEQLPGSRVESKVRLRAAGLELVGSIDLDDLDGVVDLKTVGEHRLAAVRRLWRPFYHNRVQVSSYALARLQMGRPVRWVAYLYMDRASGAEEVVVEPFTNALALEVIDRVTLLRALSADPDRAPRDERGPGLSLSCDECPWLKRCWGPDAEPSVVGPQAVSTDPEIIAALADYDDARARASQAEADKKWALARLNRAAYGTYGPYRYGRKRDIEETDRAAAEQRLVDLGEPVPKKKKRGAVDIKVVSRVPQPGEGKP